MPIKSHAVSVINALASPKNQNEILGEYDWNFIHWSLRARIWATDLTCDGSRAQHCQSEHEETSEADSASRQHTDSECAPLADTCSCADLISVCLNLDRPVAGDARTNELENVTVLPVGC